MLISTQKFKNDVLITTNNFSWSNHYGKAFTPTHCPGIMIFEWILTLWMAPPKYAFFWYFRRVGFFLACLWDIFSSYLLSPTRHYWDIRESRSRLVGHIYPSASLRKKFWNCNFYILRFSQDLSICKNSKQ